jgi:branched-chain amino acid transport system substrate-binding protein
MKLYTSIVLALLILAAAPACSLLLPVQGPSIKPDVLKVGVLVPMTGDFPSYGESTHDGVQLAIDEWNDRGGVFGTAIDVVYDDSSCESEAAAESTLNLIQQNGVHYLIGEVCSQASIAAAEIANNYSVVQVVTASVNPLVTVDDGGVVRPYTFRAIVTEPAQAPGAATFARNKLNASSAGIVYNPDSSYASALAKAFELAFKQAGGKNAGLAACTSEKSCAPLLAALKAASPDVIYLPGLPEDVNTLARQIKAIGLTAPLLGSGGWVNPGLDQTALESAYYTYHYAIDDPTPSALAFRKAYGERYKDKTGAPKLPDVYAELAYEATQVMLQALQKVGADDPAAVRATLESGTFDIPGGTLRFDKQHNPQKPIAILQIQSGQARYVESVSSE